MSYTNVEVINHSTSQAYSISDLKAISVESLSESLIEVKMNLFIHKTALSFSEDCAKVLIALNCIKLYEHELPQTLLCCSGVSSYLDIGWQRESKSHNRVAPP